MNELFTGRCHCGAIGFEYRTAITPSSWSVRACSCGFCRAHGALSTSDPGGELRFLERESGAARRYRFAQRTADFLLCGRCGVYVGAAIETARGRFGIVNTRALDPVPSGIPEPNAVSYDAESTAQRIQRREQRWTPLFG